jgi:circadian clock protein KaiC
MDSLKDIELATPDKVRYKDYIYSLVNDFRRQGITSLLTSEIPEMFGDFTVSEYGVSFVTDNVVLMRYVEMEGHVARALSVLKMRGSDHDKSVREYHITAEAGIGVLEPFVDYDTVLTGATAVTAPPGADLLAPYPRRVLHKLTGTTAQTLEDLANACKLDLESTREAVDTLLQLGYLVRRIRDGKTLYQATATTG